MRSAHGRPHLMGSDKSGSRVRGTVKAAHPGDDEAPTLSLGSPLAPLRLEAFL